MELSVLLFLLAALVMAAFIYFGTLDAQVMPWACPSCYHGSSGGSGASVPWYQKRPDGTVYCRNCGKAFREHPNGSLIEVR